MNDGDLKDIPTFKKLIDDASRFMMLKNAWPFFKPIAKIMGMDIKGIEEQLVKIPELAKHVEEMIAIPDRFNDTFENQGWILIESMELDAARKAISIAEEGKLEEADEFLADYFSSEWVETRINWLKYIDGFQTRFKLAIKALEDYKAGRYYASILVTLTIMDGWVNELNIVDFHRQGFFAENSDLTAWDSITAHSKGLERLKTLMGEKRQRTRTEEITIPFRHGILHGMDLGYDNKIVAAKCWAALFAVRDWAIKVKMGELEPKPEEPPQTNMELLRDLQISIESYKRLSEWKPREVIIGKDIPKRGNPNDYQDGSAEQKLAEFLFFWESNNYGYMARCTSTKFGSMEKEVPKRIREAYESKKLRGWKFITIHDIAYALTEIEVNVIYRIEEENFSKQVKVGLLCENPEKDWAIPGMPDSKWVLTLWDIF